VYSFNHLSVQEYFCALYISLLPEDQQLDLLKDHITDYPHIWRFYAGITKLRSSDLSLYLFQFLLQDKQLEKVLSYQQFQEIFTLSHQVTIALNSIYETQLSSDNCKHKLFSLYISHHRLLPYDCMSIAYFMSIASVKCLVLCHCEFGDQEAEMLARCKHHLPLLKVLDLKGNNITHKGMKSLTTIIKSSTITHFSVAHNPIFDDGIQLLKFKHLIHLNIWSVRMTEHGAFALGENFKLNDSLQSLKIGCNSIKDSGLTGILDNLPSTLVQLIASSCHLTYNGAVSIGKMLKINKTIKYLDITRNSIGDDGISAISDSLHVNTTLIQLVTRHCEFNDKGAKSVAKMLQENRTLKYLNISFNDIGDDGMTAVINSIQANTTLIQLKIFGYQFCFKNIKSLNEMLMVNKTLTMLDITCDDNAGDKVTSILETFLKNSCKLAQLHIDHSTNEPCTCEVSLQRSNVTATNAMCYTSNISLSLYTALHRRCTLKVYIILTMYTVSYIINYTTGTRSVYRSHS